MPSTFRLAEAFEAMRFEVPVHGDSVVLNGVLFSMTAQNLWNLVLTIAEKPLPWWLKRRGTLPSIRICHLVSAT